MQGEFVQTDPDSKQRHGRFYFQRPGKARFDYASPSSLRIISDGRNLVIEDHSLNTSERYPLDVTPFKLLLSDKVDLANDAHVLGVEQGPDMFILTVEEKDANGSGRIRLFFNKADTSLKEWIITDAQGLDTRIEVSNLDNEQEDRREPLHHLGVRERPRLVTRFTAALNSFWRSSRKRLRRYRGIVFELRRLLRSRVCAAAFHAAARSGMTPCRTFDRALQNLLARIFIDFPSLRVPIFPSQVVST